MKNKILLIIGIALIIAGTVVSYFAGFPLADVTGFSVVMFGAGLASATFWAKRDETKNKLLSVAGIVGIGLGAFLLGFGGLAEATMTTIITSVFGLVLIIAGIVFSAVNTKN